MPLRPAYPVRSARLALRPLTEADVDGIVAYRSLPEVCRWVPFETMDAASVRARIREKWSQSTAIEQEEDALFLGIELAGEPPGGDARGDGGTGGIGGDGGGEVIGTVMLRWASAEHGSGELGYEVNPAYQGAGYATEASHAILHLGFEGLGARMAGPARGWVRLAPAGVPMMVIDRSQGAGTSAAAASASASAERSPTCSAYQAGATCSAIWRRVQLGSRGRSHSDRPAASNRRT